MISEVNNPSVTALYPKIFFDFMISLMIKITAKKNFTFDAIFGETFFPRT